MLALLDRGDRRGAVEKLMELHQETVFAYCVRTLRDRELAEDVAQQVFTEAYRDLERFRRESSLRTWLLGIAHHRCGDAIFVIHGHGTGALRAAVRSHLQGHSAIEKFRPGEQSEGGDGVTVAFLKG